MKLRNFFLYIFNFKLLIKRIDIFLKTEKTDVFFSTLLNSSNEQKECFSAIYDLNYNSRSFNIVPFLILCEIYRKRKSYKNFNVYILENDLPKKLQHKEFVDNLGEDNLSYRNLNLFPSLCSLLPNCKSFHYIFDRKKFFKECTLSNVFPENFYKKPSIEKGFDVPLHKYLCENEPEDFFHVPKNIVKTFDKIHKRSLKKLITFTIRNSKFDPIRNSNQLQILNVINTIKNEFEILVIPDTEDPKLIEELERYVRPSSIAASFNLAIRLKLYEETFLNIFPDSGPFELVCYGKKISYIFLKNIKNSLIINDNYDYAFTYDSNNQLKWATKKQIVISEEKNTDNFLSKQIQTFSNLYEKN